MASVRREGTDPERKIRSMLHKAGYRFKLHRKNLPGTPDIVLPKYNTVIFVHGCFWHQHSGCSKSRRPSSNQNYWEKKLDGNIERDKKKIAELKKMGWKAIIVWQCEIENESEILRKIRAFLQSS